MFKRIRGRNVMAATLMFGAVLATVQGAYAWTQTWAPAGVCSLGLGRSSSPNLIAGGSGDIVNRGSTRQGLTCGVGQDEGSMTDDDRVVIFFRDGDGVPGSDLWCRALSTSPDITTHFAQEVKFACSNDPLDGCSPGVVFEPFAGVGQMTLAVEHGLDARIAISCELPGKTATSAHSQIHSIMLRQP